MSIKVAIVDDNSFIAQAIAEKLESYTDIALKYTVYNGDELLAQLEQRQNLDLILMDIEMPVRNGVETTEVVKRRYPHIKILMLTVFDNDEHIFKAICAGADGYLLKEIGGEKLYKAITETMEGGAAMSPAIAVKTLRLLRFPEKRLPMQPSEEGVELSKREQEVLEQLAEGLSYTLIATNLYVSPSTVRKHIENIYKKLQVHNKLEAVQKARKEGLL